MDGNRCDSKWAIDTKTRNRLAHAMNGIGGGGKGAKEGRGREGLGRLVQGADLRCVSPPRGGKWAPAAAVVPPMTEPRPRYRDESRARGGNNQQDRSPQGGKARGRTDTQMSTWQPARWRMGGQHGKRRNSSGGRRGRQRR